MTAGGAGARLASALALIRDVRGGGGVEVLMVRRSGGSSFAPHALAFPGGTLDESDFVSGRDVEGAVGSLARRMGLGNDVTGRRNAAAHAIAAVRELLEECGILLGTRSDGVALTAQDGARLEAVQTALLRGDSLAAVLSRHNLTPALDELVYAARFVTPVERPTRFDARFFLARPPKLHHLCFNAAEVADGGWHDPRALLDGGVALMPPTRVFCTELARHGTARAASLALGRSPLRFVPNGVT